MARTMAADERAARSPRDRPGLEGERPRGEGVLCEPWDRGARSLFVAEETHAGRGQVRGEWPGALRATHAGTGGQGREALVPAGARRVGRDGGTRTSRRATFGFDRARDAAHSRFIQNDLRWRFGDS